VVLPGLQVTPQPLSGLVEGFVEHGVVDEMRRPKPSYAAWKRLTALARIEAHWIGDPATRFTATVTPNSEHQLPSYPLHDYQLAWTVQDEAGVTLASGARHLRGFVTPEQVAGSVPRDFLGRSCALPSPCWAPPEPLQPYRPWPGQPRRPRARHRGTPMNCSARQITRGGSGR